MKYTALSINYAPKIPGVYRIIYKDHDCYIGVSRDLRSRFKVYNRFANVPQWRLDLCKQSHLRKTFSLQAVFKMTVFLFEYEILETFDLNVSSVTLADAEKHYFNVWCPKLNRAPPGYPRVD